MPLGNLATANTRREDRDLVHHATFLTTPGGERRPIVIVNISPHGFMARCDPAPEPDTRIALALPEVDTVVAEIRWALGGRVGCEFAQAIPLDRYYALLAKLRT